MTLAIILSGLAFLASLVAFAIAATRHVANGGTLHNIYTPTVTVDARTGTDMMRQYVKASRAIERDRAIDAKASIAARRLV